MRDKIERILVLGDSLSDRGTMAKSALDAFSGLPGNSPHGRFTNGYVWLDYLIQKLHDSQPTPQVPVENKSKLQKNKSIFAINNDEYVGTKTAPIFARTYCKGGMTAHDYSNRILPGQPVLNAESRILATLDGMRKEAEIDDQYIMFDNKDKASTLVIEWSGANDLITVNAKPTTKAADLAVDARIENVKRMISSGYKHFVLVNLPDLSLTPRYQNKKRDQIDEAHEAVSHFNASLADKVSALKEQHPDCKIDIFDANDQFVDAYNNPAQYGLSINEIHEPFLDSDVFKKEGERAPENAADIYMFWDEVHPAKTLHMQLANRFHQAFFDEKYDFQFSNEPLIKQFRQAYGMKWQADSHGTCGVMKRSRIDYLSETLTIKDILHHGLFNKGQRTHGVMHQLGWIHANKQCATDHPRIVEAMAELNGTTAIVEASADAESTQGIEITMR